MYSLKQNVRTRSDSERKRGNTVPGSKCEWLKVHKIIHSLQKTWKNTCWTKEYTKEWLQKKQRVLYSSYALKLSRTKVKFWQITRSFLNKVVKLLLYKLHWMQLMYPYIGINETSWNIEQINFIFSKSSFFAKVNVFVKQNINK